MILHSFKFILSCFGYNNISLYETYLSILYPHSLFVCSSRRVFWSRIKNMAQRSADRTKRHYWTQSGHQTNEISTFNDRNDYNGFVASVWTFITQLDVIKVFWGRHLYIRPPFVYLNTFKLTKQGLLLWSGHKNAHPIH